MATRILFFGALREWAGGAEKLIETPARLSVAELIDFISDDDAELRAALSAPSVRIAVDQSIVDRYHTIAKAREVAFMPAFSGG